MPDGHLSPAAFSPVSRAAAATAAQSASAAALLPGGRNGTVLRLAFEQAVPAGVLTALLFGPLGGPRAACPLCRASLLSCFEHPHLQFKILKSARAHI